MKPLFDIHTHTIASGHGTHATITDMAKAAKAAGLTMLGISDHGPATVHGGKPSYFKSLMLAPRKRLGVDMLYGIEANILDYQGRLDLSDGGLASLDYVIASMHTQNIRPGSIEENTAAYLGAIKNRNVDIIGHCDDVKYPVDYELLVKAAKENHTIFEINDSSLREDGYRGEHNDVMRNDLTLLALCKEHALPVILSSDSHGPAHVGDFTCALKLIKEAAFPERLILNYESKVLFHSEILR